MRSSAMLLLAPLMFTHSYAQAQIPEDQNAGCDSSNMASTYVPIESWIYPAIERLALAGYVQTAFAGLRPWTRMEIARLVAEAQEQQADLDPEEVPDEQMNLLSYASGMGSAIIRPQSTRSTGAALRSPALR
jgi:hypothetical protein